MLSFFLGKIPLFLHFLTPGKRQSLENVEKSVEKKRNMSLYHKKTSSESMMTVKTANTGPHLRKWWDCGKLERVCPTWNRNSLLNSSQFCHVQRCNQGSQLLDFQKKPEITFLSEYFRLLLFRIARSRVSNNHIYLVLSFSTQIIELRFNEVKRLAQLQPRS